MLIITWFINHKLKMVCLASLWWEYCNVLHAHNSVPPDPTMTVDNVTQMLNKIQGDKWEGVIGGGVSIPFSLLEEIQSRYSTDTEKNHACADYYVNYHPKAEWKHLTRALYLMKEFAAARESKSFMSTGKYYIITMLKWIIITITTV